MKKQLTMMVAGIVLSVMGTQAMADAAANYQQICFACHGTGAAGAPIVGNKDAWKPRIATGMDALYNSALHGKNAMPAKGGRTDLSDAEVKAIVDYMVSQSK